MLDVDIGLYSARTTTSYLLRPRNLCVHWAFRGHESWFLVQVTGLEWGLVPISFLHSFRTLSNCWCWMLMLVYIAQEKPGYLCYVQDTFVSTTPLGVMARGSSGPVYRFEPQVLFQLWYVVVVAAFQSPSQAPLGLGKSLTTGFYRKKNSRMPRKEILLFKNWKRI